MTTDAADRRSPVRRFLTRLYDVCGAAAGVLLVCIALIVLWDVGGGIFGYIPRAAEELAGYCMVGSAFLGFAHTLARGEHIRVTLLVGHLRGGAAYALGLAAGGATAGLTGALAWYSLRMTWQSWVFNDVAQGLIAIPLWIPQVCMTFGSIVFFIATLEALFDVATGRPNSSTATNAGPHDA